MLFSPRLGEAIFNLVYFHQLSMPVEVPSLAQGYIWFANGIIGAVMAGWMICIILLARGPFLEGRPHAWNTIAIPLASWFLIDTAFSGRHGGDLVRISNLLGQPAEPAARSDRLAAAPYLPHA